MTLHPSCPRRPDHRAQRRAHATPAPRTPERVIETMPDGGEVEVLSRLEGSRGAILEISRVTRRGGMPELSIRLIPAVGVAGRALNFRHHEIPALEEACRTIRGG